MIDCFERRNHTVNVVINLPVLTCGVLAGMLVELSFVGFGGSYDAHYKFEHQHTQRIQVGTALI